MMNEATAAYRKHNRIVWLRGVVRRCIAAGLVVLAAEATRQLAHEVRSC
jgi:hypothetical protein